MLGPFLFTLGIIVGISAGAKMPAEGATYPDTWPVFLGAAALSVVGLVIWRMKKAAERAATSQRHASGKSPFDYIRGVVDPAKALVAEMESLSTAQMCERVDALLDGYLLPLAEVRQGVIDKLGMSKGAEVLVTVAYGERMLNRTWSAAADEHLPEARAVLPDAVDALEEAARLIA